MLEYDDELSERLGLSLPSPVTYLDSNNNSSAGKRGDKYALRPRSMRRKNLMSDFEEIPLVHPKSSTSKHTSNGSIAKPQKPKSAPLSKYRRKTANARERTRMREINQAFEALRMAVPQIAPNQQQNEKLTKITTLRLAMKYISALSAALSSSPAELPQQDIFSECSELESFLLESDGESLPLNSDGSDHSLTPADFSAVDFDDSLTSVDFSSDFSNHLPFDTYLSDFS
ncbi:helix-loop-helix protein delilah-like [Anthonomus grandis grandis]|uniref:helix-loop-helix protein delilah-like n=1 Tax=Anthonomus grandis grandis TaxID=2921223 RepID=UPI002165E260|nr:helix-loop-helix protein delilah-like [Anthonomus grandis grandis]